MTERNGSVTMTDRINSVLVPCDKLQEMKDSFASNEANLRATIAEQAEQIKMLRKALTVAINYYADVGSEHWNLFDTVLTLTGGMDEPT